MKKWLLIAFGIILLASSVFYFEKTKEKAVDSSIEKKLEEKDYDDFIVNTTDYIGYKIEDEGLVEESVYIKGEGVYTTVVLNPDEYSNVILLFEKDQKRVIEPRNTVLFSGNITEIYKNKKTFNRLVKLPKIKVDTLTLENKESIDNKDLFQVDIRKKQQKKGTEVTLEKIAIFNSATRIYLTISNQSKHDIYLNEASIQLFADGELIATKYEMLDKKVRLERYLRPNNETYGALSFKEIMISTKKLQLKISFSSGEQEQPIDYNFKVTL